MYLTPPLKGFPLKLGIGASGQKSSNDGTWFPPGHGEWKDRRWMCLRVPGTSSAAKQRHRSSERVVNRRCVCSVSCPSDGSSWLWLRYRRRPLREPDKLFHTLSLCLFVCAGNNNSYPCTLRCAVFCWWKRSAQSLFSFCTFVNARVLSMHRALETARIKWYSYGNIIYVCMYAFKMYILLIAKCNTVNYGLCYSLNQNVWPAESLQCSYGIIWTVKSSTCNLSTCVVSL